MKARNRAGFFSLLLACTVTQGIATPTQYLSFTTDYPASYDVGGFDWLSRLELFRVFDGKGKTHSFKHASRNYEVRWDAETKNIEILEQGKPAASVSLHALLEKLRASRVGTKTQSSLVEEVLGPGGVLRMYVEDISAEWRSDGESILHHLKADLLFRSHRAAKAR